MGRCLNEGLLSKNSSPSTLDIFPASFSYYSSNRQCSVIMLRSTGSSRGDEGR